MIHMTIIGHETRSNLHWKRLSIAMTLSNGMKWIGVWAKLISTKNALLPKEEPIFQYDLGLAFL